MVKMAGIVLCLLMSAAAEARLTASPTYVNFFNTEVGSFGRSRTVTIRNTSQSHEMVRVTDTCSGGFSVSGHCGSLGPGRACSLRVHFRPRRVGHQSCSLYVRSGSGGGGSLSIRVSGRGVDRRR